MKNIAQKTTLLEDLFKAYYDARKNKRNTINALDFEYNYESSLLTLAEDLLLGRYQVGRSFVFVVNHPVKREIFAADFRDRIVHHLIFNYINPIFERKFINDNYSCRIGKGNLYGIKRVDHFIKSCSENYQKDCYILKLDISGYFMSIDKDILFKKIKEAILNNKKNNFNKKMILEIIQKIIFNNPTKNCIIKGQKSDWNNLPKNKSLFFSKKNKGLSIGNLTSQLFGNVYLNDFDHFIKRDLKCKYYGRYVDDMIIVHQSRNFLRKIIVKIKIYLKEKLLLKLHPRKIYLQYFSKGVDFLGAYIKPYRIYIRNKVKGNFYNNIYFLKKEYFRKNINKKARKKIISSVNSYLGMYCQFNTFNLRRKIFLNNFLNNNFSWDDNLKKIY